VTQYILKRLVLMVATLFGIAVITFGVTRLTPGEPAAVAQKPGAQSKGGYDSLLEQNRRNLGLDRPMFLNFRFEDRAWLAAQALEDFCRPAPFWQDSAERNLRMASTIAVGPALDRIDALAKVQGRVDHKLKPSTDAQRVIDVDDCIKRIVDLMPSLANERPAEIESATREAKIAFWRDWHAKNKERWTPEKVEAAAEGYLAGAAALEDVVACGGYAVPHLMRGIARGDDRTQLAANRALSALTGFSYLSSPDAWDKEREDVVRRWKSFYARDRPRFVDYGPVGDFANFFRNTQFGLWFGQLARLDFGDSYKHRRSVNDVIVERLPITIVMSALSIVVSYVVAIPLGILSAVRRRGLDDKFITLALFVLYSLPSFWVGQMALLSMTGGPSPIPGMEWPEIFPTRGVNSDGLNWLSGDPRAIMDMLWHIVLPTTCITYGSLAFLSRQMRSAMLETLDEDFIRTAHAKGLSPTIVVLRHALRNSLVPILTISAGLLPELVAGSIVAESIFNIPGMGLLAFESILNRDYPVINAILFFSAALTLIGILLADLSYAFADPRIAYD